MNNYVLFSALGKSDPIRTFRDGPFIHICRVYKPQKIYLYMTKEICNYDDIDNRYEYTLQKLCELLSFECEVEKIKKYELEDASDFERFYNEFISITDKIAKDNPDKQLLLNLSSGTPQIKQALAIINVLAERKTVSIQVKSPVKAANTAETVKENYSLEEEWVCNEDNDPQKFENRCLEIEQKNLIVLLKKEIIGKHVFAYNYTAALEVAKTMPGFLTERAVNLIEYGINRLAVDTSKAETYARLAGYKTEQNFKDKKMKFCFEYIAMLSIKIKKRELADFIRAISPVLTELFELYLKYKCDLDIEKFYYKDNRDIPKLSHEDLKNNRNDIFEYLTDCFKTEIIGSNPVSARHLSAIINFVGKNDIKAVQLAADLRRTESDARNTAAHTIQAVTDEWLKEKINKTADEILEDLKTFFKYIYSLPSDIWETYDVLNTEILTELGTY